MFLKEGDRVMISVNPSIPLAEYQNAKPFASVARDLSEDVPGDLEEMRHELRQMLFRSLVIELECRSDAMVALEEGGFEGLVRYCKKEIGDVASKAYVSKEKGGGKKPQKAKAKKPVKKAKKG